MFEIFCNVLKCKEKKPLGSSHGNIVISSGRIFLEWSNPSLNIFSAISMKALHQWAKKDVADCLCSVIITKGILSRADKRVACCEDAFLECGFLAELALAFAPQINFASSLHILINERVSWYQEVFKANKFQA